MYGSIKCHYSSKISPYGHTYMLGWHCTTKKRTVLKCYHLREKFNPSALGTFIASTLTPSTDCEEDIFSPVFILELDTSHREVADPKCPQTHTEIWAPGLVSYLSCVPQGNLKRKPLSFNQDLGNPTEQLAARCVGTGLEAEQFFVSSPLGFLRGKILTETLKPPDVHVLSRQMSIMFPNNLHVWLWEMQRYSLETDAQTKESHQHW